MNRLLQRLQMKGNGNYYSPYTTCQVNWITMLDVELEGVVNDLD